MKHNKTNFSFDEIKAYSQPMTDENLQNVADLFTASVTAEAPARPKAAVRRPMRLVLAAAMSVVMIFSVAMAASAELREVVFGMIFTASSTEKVDDGLLLDRFIIFEEAIAENQYAYVFRDTIYKYYSDTGYPAAFYAYKDGAIVEIESPEQNPDDWILKDGFYYDYGQEVFSNRIGRNAENAEYTEFINPQTDEIIKIEGNIISIVLSPNGEWAAYSNCMKANNNELLIYNTQTGKTFSTGMIRIQPQDEITSWSYSWLVDGVLALIEGKVVFRGEPTHSETRADGAFVEYYDEPGSIIHGESQLYVFRIDEKFMNQVN
jgi:hypothetical protein